MNNLQSIVSHFNTKGTVNEIQPLGSGLINDTYKVTTLEADAPDLSVRNLRNRERMISTARYFLLFLPIREKRIGTMAKTIGAL